MFSHLAFTINQCGEEEKATCYPHKDELTDTQKDDVTCLSVVTARKHQSRGLNLGLL